MAITINGSANTVAGLVAGGLPDNTVDGGNLAMGSDAAGDVLYYNGTDYIRLAKGTDGQVLTLASGVPTWATPASADYVKIFTETLSGNTAGWSKLKSAEATLFDDTYSWKFLKFTNVRPQSDAGVWELRFTYNGDNGTFRGVSNTDENYHKVESEILPSNAETHRSHTGSGKIDLMHHWGNSSAESHDMELWWSDVHSTGQNKLIHFRCFGRNYDGGKPQYNYGGGYWTGTNGLNAIEGIQIDGNNGGLGDCKIDAYGLK